MATKKQLAARKRFAAMARAGAFRKNPKKKKARKARKARRMRKNPMAVKKAKHVTAKPKVMGIPRRKGKKPGPKKGSKRGGKRTARKSAGMKAILKKLNQLRGAKKRMKPRTVVSKRGKSRKVYSKSKKITSARIAALELHRRSLQKRGKGKLTKMQRMALQSHGLMRVNGGLLEQITTRVMPAASTLVSIVVAAYGAEWASQQIGQYIPASIAQWTPAIMCVGVGVAGYAALEYAEKSWKMAGLYKGWVLAGGLIAAMFHVANKMGWVPASVKATLGFGDYSVGDYTVGSYSVGDYQLGESVPGSSMAIQGDGIFGGLGDGSVVMDPSRRLMAASSDDIVRHNTRRDMDEELGVLSGSDGIFGQS